MKERTRLTKLEKYALNGMMANKSLEGPLAFSEEIAKEFIRLSYYPKPTKNTILNYIKKQIMYGD